VSRCGASDEEISNVCYWPKADINACSGFMQALAPRFIDAAEATRLGVQSGWYGAKASGTFVTGPHETEKNCERTLVAQKK
jgi:hypothetical protein